jgi:Fe-S cluster biosynthesis and repair protein YggX
MGRVQCSRCGEEKEGLAAAPFHGELGARIAARVCGDCWKAWLAEQTLQMNEKRLSLAKPEHRDLLARALEEFLRLG